MRLKCYALTPQPPALVASTQARAWMDAFPSRHAYRCLPLNIANVHGWELRCPCSFELIWNGGDRAEDITIRALDDFPYLHHFANSHFTRGIVTFMTGYLFVTEPGWNVLATGPFNQPRDGISPLTGVIETDWLPYPFTMNWQLTRPGTVRFERGDTFCLIVPVRKDDLEAVEVEIFNLADDAELEKKHAAWRDRREEFMAKFRAGDADTLKEAWQKFYFRGVLPDGGESPEGHKQKIRLADPVDRRRHS